MFLNLQHQHELHTDIAPDPMHDPRHFTGGGVYVKELIMYNRGSAVEQHVHKFDHLSLLARGSVMVEEEHEDVACTRTYQAPTAVLIRAGIKHKIVALTDDVLWYCIHAIPTDLQVGEDIEAALISDAKDTEASK